ncbi:MAG: sigma factor-like helix-turn-helix DNA-binding protein [Candidatus Pacearchaeota archaeon]
MEEDKIKRIVELHKNGSSYDEIAKELNVSTQTIRVYLRREGFGAKRRNQENYRKALEAYTLGLSQQEAAKYANTCQSEISRIWTENYLVSKNKRKTNLEESVLNERKTFAKSLGLDDLIFNKIRRNNYVPDTYTLKDSYYFFLEIGADAVKELTKRPILATLDRNVVLNPKREFFKKIGIPERKTAKNPEVYMNGLNKMSLIYENLSKYLGSKEKAVKILSNAITIFGNEWNYIKNKLEIYDKEKISYIKNPSLLEKKPKSVIETRDYLEKRLKLTCYSQKLLGINKNPIKKKIKYLNRKKIKWRKYPNILILGIGTKEKPGALIRRIKMISDAFPNKDYPDTLDYINKPSILTQPDKIIKIRIKNAKE